MKIDPLDFNPRVSDKYAIIIIIIAGFLIAWLTVNVGTKIIAGTANSEISSIKAINSDEVLEK